jgi:hypothetical protein
MIIVALTTTECQYSVDLSKGELAPFAEDIR